MSTGDTARRYGTVRAGISLFSGRPAKRGVRIIIITYTPYQPCSSSRNNVPRTANTIAHLPDCFRVLLLPARTRHPTAAAAAVIITGETPPSARAILYIGRPRARVTMIIVIIILYAYDTRRRY